MTTTAELCSLIKHTPEALAWQASAGHLTGPGPDGLWDVTQVRRELGAYRRRSRAPRPRGVGSPADIVAADRAERLANTIVTTYLTGGVTEVRDGHGRYCGCVIRDGEVWRIRPLSREQDANLCLPARDTRQAAADALFFGRYTI